jgi:hypothetical protein
MRTREDFALALLKQLDAPLTKRNLWALLSWMQAEGDAARFNPFGTTLKRAGSTTFNSHGVQNYASFDQGVSATAETINYGADKRLYGYQGIRYRLRHNAWAVRTLEAVARSNWGTGALALLCLPWVKLSYEKYANKLIVQ